MLATLAGRPPPHGHRRSSSSALKWRVGCRGGAWHEVAVGRGEHEAAVQAARRRVPQTEGAVLRGTGWSGVNVAPRVMTRGSSPPGTTDGRPRTTPGPPIRTGHGTAPAARHWGTSGPRNPRRRPTPAARPSRGPRAALSAASGITARPAAAARPAPAPQRPQRPPGAFRGSAVGSGATRRPVQPASSLSAACRWQRRRQRAACASNRSMVTANDGSPMIKVLPVGQIRAQSDLDRIT